MLNSYIAGFVIAGGTAKTLLVRAVGPSLGGMGVSGFLPSGQLAIHDGSGAKIAENLGAGFDIYPTQVAAQVGAFPLAAERRDNMLLVTLPPGQYTAQVRGTNGNSGVVLTEIYEVP